MRALGLPADRFEDNAIVLARLLDGQSGDYELASGRMPETPDTAYGSDADRFVVVEQFHNAFRRITTDWDSVLNRRTMDSNLERLPRIRCGSNARAAARTCAPCSICAGRRTRRRTAARIASPENQTVRNTATMFSHNGKPFSCTFTAEQAKQLQFIHY